MLRPMFFLKTAMNDDDIVLHPINNSCNKVTLSLTSLDCCLRINACIHRTYGSKVCRIAEHFGLFLKVTSKCDDIDIPWWKIGPINRILVVYYILFWWCDFIIHIIGGHYTSHDFGGIQCTTPAGNTDFVGVVKRVLTLTKSSVICSYVAVLIKPQPPTKDPSKLCGF